MDFVIAGSGFNDQWQELDRGSESAATAFANTATAVGIGDDCTYNICNYNQFGRSLPDDGRHEEE